MKKLTKANANNGRGFTAAKAGDKSGFRIEKESVRRTILHQPNNMSPAQWVPDCIGNILHESCSDFPLPEADKAIIYALTYDDLSD
jgi:hypothetical protein